MYKYKYPLLLAGILFLAASCRKNVQDTSFYGDSKIFFAPQNDSDSLVYSFANNAAADFTELRLPLNIMGKASTEDRMVTVAINQSRTTALPSEYELGQAVIPAGSVTGYVPLKLINAPRLESNSVQLALYLESSPAFLVEKQDSGKLNELVNLDVIWTNILAKPDDWPQAQWGGYSKIKHRLVIDLTGHFLYSGADWTAGAFVFRVLGICNEWLEAYNATHAEPYKDESGNPIRFCAACF